MSNAKMIKRCILWCMWFLISLAFEFDICSEQFSLESSFSQQDCKPNARFQETGNLVHNCFPQCVETIDKSRVELDLCDPRICPLGYKCVQQQIENGEEETEDSDDDDEDTLESYCRLDENSCMKYYAGQENSNPWDKTLWKPNCTVNSNWFPRQCKGNRCFCVDENGKRIFGEAFKTDAAKMTCACSRFKNDLLKRKIPTTIHCDEMGNFEPLQCNLGQCWCTHPETGEITAKFVPESLMQLLPCYSKEEVGEQYLRQCESIEHASTRIRQEFGKRGQSVSLPHIICDWDGSYGRFLVKDGEISCRWKNNKELTHPMAISSNKIKEYNCNCARDKTIYGMRGYSHSSQCQPNGAYQFLQQSSDSQWYCVDADGYAKSEPTSTQPDCNIYSQ